GFIAGTKLMAAFGEQVVACDIEELPMEYAAVACDLESGREVWMREGSLVTAVRASIAIPGVFSPVLVDDRWRVDGGLVNPLPVAPARALRPDIVPAANVNERLVLPGGRRPYALSRADEAGFSERLRRRWSSEPPDTPNVT